MAEAEYFAALAATDRADGEFAFDKQFVADDFYLLRERRRLRAQHAGHRRVAVGQRHGLAHRERSLGAGDEACSTAVAASELDSRALCSGYYLLFFYAGYAERHADHGVDIEPARADGAAVGILSIGAHIHAAVFIRTLEIGVF